MCRIKPITRSLLINLPIWELKKPQNSTEMRAFSSLILALALAVLPATVVYCGFPVPLLSLHRAFPSSLPVQLETLRARDRLRHARILQGVVDFSVEGSSDPLLVGYRLLFISIFFHFFAVLGVGCGCNYLL